MEEIGPKANSHQGFTKGHLYKIKECDGTTRGYLFGTMHELGSDSLSRLHPKIIRSLSKSKALYLELNLSTRATYSVTKLTSYLPFLPEALGKTSPQLIQQAIAEMMENPSGMEEVLERHAKSLELSTHSLETFESRLCAKIQIQSNVEALKETKLAIFGFACRNAATEFVALLNAGDNWEDKFDTSFNALFDVIKHADFSKDIDDFSKQRKILRSKFELLLKKYGAYLIAAFGQEGKETFELLQLAYLAAEKLANGESPIFAKRLKQTQEAYDKGEKEPFEHASPLPGSPWAVEFEKLVKEETFARDTFMLARIQTSLKSLENTDRNFYAVGSGHLLDEDYDNLRSRLEKKGWTIVDAYAPGGAGPLSKEEQQGADRKPS